MTKQKRPVIGFIGMIIILFGILLFCVVASVAPDAWAIPICVSIAGVGVLVYALVTGNVKMFG